MRLMLSVVLFLAIFLPYITGKIDNLKESIRVKNLKITACDSKTNYPVTVSNVSISLIDLSSKVIQFGGSLSVGIDLEVPIMAVLKMEREVLGMWIPIPCEKNLGSCTYNDLCKFGYPSNKTCPPNFLQENVPCRCPIPKGNYTIEPTMNLSGEGSIYTGTYKGVITLKQPPLILSCYNIHFVLEDEYSLRNLYSVVRV